MADVLLRHGAGINLQDREGVTALRSAALEGHERVVDVLIQHGAEINLQCNLGGTALMAAAFRGRPAVVLRLLRTGADMTLRTAAGKIAKEKGHGECVEAFRTYLGEVKAARSKAPSAEAGGAGAGGAPAGAAVAGASAAVSASSGLIEARRRRCWSGSTAAGGSTRGSNTPLMAANV